MRMADKIIMRPVESLIPYARNARTHSEAQVAQIAGSIREFGFTNPLPVDGENGIIAGHGRVLVARLLGMVSRCRASSSATSRRRSAARTSSPTTSWR
jgi:ParB-like chromosome segregation protein Spo0J